MGRSRQHFVKCRVYTHTYTHTYTYTHRHTHTHPQVCEMRSPIQRWSARMQTKRHRATRGGMAAPINTHQHTTTHNIHTHTHTHTHTHNTQDVWDIHNRYLTPSLNSHTCTLTLNHTHAPINSPTHTHTHTHTNTHTHIYTHTHTHTHIHIPTCPYIPPILLSEVLPGVLQGRR